VFYTDGVSEARDIKANEFGLDRLVEVLEDAKALSAKGIIDVVLRKLKAFQGRAPQHDDITLIVIKRV